MAERRRMFHDGCARSQTSKTIVQHDVPASSSSVNAWSCSLRVIGKRSSVCVCVCVLCCVVCLL
jgi:hypothetical protein